MVNIPNNHNPDEQVVPEENLPTIDEYMEMMTSPDLPPSIASATVVNVSNGQNTLTLQEFMSNMAAGMNATYISPGFHIYVVNNEDELPDTIFGTNTTGFTGVQHSPHVSDDDQIPNSSEQDALVIASPIINEYDYPNEIADIFFGTNTTDFTGVQHSPHVSEDDQIPNSSEQDELVITTPIINEYDDPDEIPDIIFGNNVSETTYVQYPEHVSDNEDNEDNEEDEDQIPNSLDNQIQNSSEDIIVFENQPTNHHDDDPIADAILQIPSSEDTIVFENQSINHHDDDPIADAILQIPYPDSGENIISASFVQTQPNTNSSSFPFYDEPTLLIVSTDNLSSLNFIPYNSTISSPEEFDSSSSSSNFIPASYSPVHSSTIKYETTSSSSSNFVPANSSQIYSSTIKYENKTIRHMDIPDLTSQEMWDNWNSKWAFFKKEADMARVRLTSTDYDPFDSLIMIGEKYNKKLRSISLNSLAKNILQASGRVVDMEKGLIFPINTRGLNRTKKYTSTLSQNKKIDYFIKLYDKLPKNIQDHLCCAGGSIHSLILNFKKTPNDYDLFFFGDCDPIDLIEKVCDLWQEYIAYAIRSRLSLTIFLKLPDTDRFIQVQFILRHYRCPAEIVYGFDIDVCACLYFNQRFYATPGCIESMEKMTIFIDVDRLSTTAVNRYSKYWGNYGYTLSIPMSWPRAYLDTHLTLKIDLDTYQDQSGPRVDYTDRNCLYNLFWHALNRSNSKIWKQGCINYGNDYHGNANVSDDTSFCENLDYASLPDNIYIINSHAYKIISHDNWPSMKELLFSTPKIFNSIKEYMTIPDSLEFVKINPGSQGNLGIIDSPLGKMITGSFHPIKTTWAEWGRIPKFIYDQPEREEVRLTMFIISCNPNLGRIFNIYKIEPNFYNEFYSIVNRIIDLTDECEHFIKNPKYQSLLSEMESLINEFPFSLKAVCLKDVSMNKSDKIKIGEVQLLPKYGAGHVVDINEHGVTFMLANSYNSWNTIHCEIMTYFENILFVVVPFEDNMQASSSK